MAILNNIDISVSSDGKTVQEYQPSADDDGALNAHLSSGGRSSIVKYIEAIPGANFQIDYVVQGTQEFDKADYFAFHTYVDGQSIHSPVMAKDSYEKTHPRYFSSRKPGREFYDGSKWSMRPFYWKELLTTDDKPVGTMDEIKQKYGRIGTIKVEVVRQKLISKHAGEKKGHQKPADLDCPIPEKALKGQAIDMSSGLGEAKTIEVSRFWKGKQIEKRPVAVFIFLYRSKNALQVLGILPRSPSPAPLEQRDPDTLTREEAVELLRRQQVELEAARVKVKKEKAEENLRKLAAMKREAPTNEDEELSIVATPNKRPRTDAEVVELSD